MDSWKIDKLYSFNFRNLSNSVINFGSGINCITGGNGNGKTNILEAIYLLVKKKSFRKGVGFPQILSFDGVKPEIIFTSNFLNNANSNLKISAKFDIQTSKWFVDGKLRRKKLPLNVIFINPFDSYRFHTSVSFRKKFFDFYISEIDSNYLKSITCYQNALKFRNLLLKKKPPKFREQILLVDKELIKFSREVIFRRLVFIKEIEGFLRDIFKKFFSEEHELAIKLNSPLINYNKSDEDMSFLLMNILKKNLEKDCSLGYTSYGVHLDDFTLLFDGLNSYEFCSLGQQKMSYLSLLFAYIELFRYKFIIYPIVMLDDVSGELDNIRWDKLVQYLNHQMFQVLITTANDNFKKQLEIVEGIKNIKIVSGEVTYE